MNLRNFNYILMLVSGIITSIFALIYHYPIQRTIYTLLTVLIIFFIVGSLVQHWINKILDDSEKTRQLKMTEELDKEVEHLENEMDEDK